MPINQVAFTLLEAEVKLYKADASGNPGAEVWSGQLAERLQCNETWLGVETRPTGARYPKQHPLVPQYRIHIARLWALPLSALIGFQPDHQNYVLDIVWTEEETQQWHRRTFYGVTITTRNLEPPAAFEFLEDQEFLAQYFVPTSGSVATAVPPIPAAACVVRWVGTDGSRLLYTYDAATKTFTETNAGDAATRATIAADGSSIQFYGEGTAVVTATADGLTLANLHDSFPATSPRLEFYYGTELVAAVTSDGLWAWSLADGTLAAAVAGQFQLQHSGTTMALLGPGLTKALAFNVTA